MNTVYLIDGKPHRFCDCDPMVQTCAKGGTRPLQTCGFGQCLVPAPDVMLVASEKPATNQEFHQWLESYKPGVVFDNGDMAACWHAAQRSSAK